MGKVGIIVLIFKLRKLRLGFYSKLVVVVDLERSFLDFLFCVRLRNGGMNVSLLSRRIIR